MKYIFSILKRWRRGRDDAAVVIPIEDIAWLFGVPMSLLPEGVTTAPVMVMRITWFEGPS